MGRRARVPVCLGRGQTGDTWADGLRDSNTCYSAGGDPEAHSGGGPLISLISASPEVGPSPYLPWRAGLRGPCGRLFLLTHSPLNVTGSNSGPTLRATQPCNHPLWKGAHLHPCPQGPRGQPSLLGLQFGLTTVQKQRPSPGMEGGVRETPFCHPRVAWKQTECTEQISQARAV